MPAAQSFSCPSLNGNIVGCAHSLIGSTRFFRNSCNTVGDWPPSWPTLVPPATGCRCKIPGRNSVAPSSAHNPARIKIESSVDTPDIVLPKPRRSDACSTQGVRLGGPLSPFANGHFFAFHESDNSREVSKAREHLHGRVVTRSIVCLIS